MKFYLTTVIATQEGPVGGQCLMQRLVHSFGLRGLGCDFCFLSSVVNLGLQFCPSLPAVRDTTTEASRMTDF